jgi:hypothetical protein
MSLGKKIGKAITKKALGGDKLVKKETPLAKAQSELRKLAKEKNMTVKNFRIKNPDNPVVRRVYKESPNIKEKDLNRKLIRKGVRTQEGLPVKFLGQKTRTGSSFKTRGKGMTSKQTEARKKLLRDASKEARTFTGFERSTRAQPTAREVKILRKKWEDAGGKRGTGKNFSDIKKQYFGKFYEGK